MTQTRFQPVWRMGGWRDQDIEISIQRKTLIALVATLLLHLLLIYVFTRPPPHVGETTAPASQAPLQLEMNLQDKPTAKPQVPDPVKVEVLPQPKHAITPTPSKPRDEEPAEIVPVPRPLELPPTQVTKPLDLTPPPATDLSSYMQAMREKRQAAEQQASGYAPPPASAEEQRMANISRNLQRPGTNGVFQIVSKGTLSAQFMFRGWTGDSSRARSEIFDVSVSPGGDLERAMIRRMIAIIRTHYSGDFNWESQRLNRVIVLSARQEDGAGLEDFLLREFFG
ncbi:hypothetical protein CSQ89_04980 [Chitinimonas sp. BJB300]|nr:hypothetical protein CSQ89_04980 [Chitinimonas sp. BJB300]